jgi:glycosyltransferase involved in cell wall biosynthesis
MTDRLRIALIASNRFPIRQPFAGGLEAHVWHLARALARRGHDVSLFAAEGSDEALGAATLTVRTLEISETARADVSMPERAFMADHHAYLTLMMQLIRDGANHFDVIHNHSLHHLPIALAPMLTVPMLTTVHTPPTPWLESAFDVTAAAGTRLAAVSQHTAASWRRTAPGIEVVPNGIDTVHWGLGPGGDHLVWFGRITPEKGTHLAIAAAKQAGLPLTLAGPVSNAHYYEEQIAPQLGVDIRYAGHLSQAELAMLVGRASAALVTPTWDEPYGLVVAEAMACGTPVVAFARGGIPELIAPCAGRLVPPGDVAAMAAGVAETRTLSRVAVRQHAQQQCSAQAMLSSYLNLYRQMIDPGKVNNDRLLRAPSRIRPPGPGTEYRPANAPTCHRADQSQSSASASVCRGHRAPA